MGQGPSLPSEFVLQPYKSQVYRLVESQEEAATLSLVDDSEEQSVLEAALDQVKPPYRENSQHRHYLISSPFRYPPLKHGSRFGTRATRSYFYASEEVETCLVEAAYYRFVFIRNKATPFSKVLRTEHHLFSVNARTTHCADLTSIDDTNIQQALQSPNDYRFCQQIGSQVRALDGEIIRFYSARQARGINVAIDAPEAIISRSPINMIPIRCETDTQARVVRCSFPRQFPRVYQESMFLVDGIFPSAA